MKKFIPEIVTFFIALILLFVPLVFAETITLTSPEPISSPTAVSMDWFVDEIDSRSHRVIVKYRWRDENGTTIYGTSRNGWNLWECRNIETPGENSECLNVGDPYECCTGVGAGSCDGYDDTCFTDVFAFQIRSQDVGMSIGAGLRTLIWNQFKADVLPTNDGTFD